MTRKRIFLLSTMAFAASCSADMPSEAHGSKGEELPAVSSATTAKTVDVIAVPAALTGDTPSAAEAESMCVAEESVLFSCATTAGKRVSLCASRGISADQGYLYYAYGTPGHPELVFPRGKRAPTDFKRTQLTFAGSTGGYAYSFENNDYRYIIYSVSGAERLEDQGVLVTRGDTRDVISALHCRRGSVVEDDDPALLDLTLAWPADPDLDQHGLPKRN